MVKYKQENPTGTLVRRRKEEKDSMRSVRQKYISLILILSMFFLGMCCGSTQADSSLMYGILHHTDSVFVNSGVDELPEIESKANKYTFVWRKTVERNRARLIDKVKSLLAQIDDCIAQDNARQDETLELTPSLLAEISDKVNAWLSGAISNAAMSICQKTNLFILVVTVMIWN